MSDRMWAGIKPGVVALAAALCVGTAVAQNNMPMNGSGSMQCSPQDKKFLKMAAEGDNFEIKTGQLAQQNGQAEDVKQFGQWMEQQHTMLNQKMQPVVQQAGMQEATGLSPKDQREYDRLEKLHGKAFDTAYIKVMLKDHKMDLAAFKKEASSGQMQEEKQAAMNGESVIQSHLDKIQQIAQAHNISAGSGTMSGM